MRHLNCYFTKIQSVASVWAMTMVSSGRPLHSPRTVGGPPHTLSSEKNKFSATGHVNGYLLKLPRCASHALLENHPFFERSPSPRPRRAATPCNRSPSIYHAETVQKALSRHTAPLMVYGVAKRDVSFLPPPVSYLTQKFVEWVQKTRLPLHPLPLHTYCLLASLPLFPQSSQHLPMVIPRRLSVPQSSACGMAALFGALINAVWVQKSPDWSSCFCFALISAFYLSPLFPQPSHCH